MKKNKIQLIVLTLILTGLIVWIANLSKVEEHCGVITNTCYNGANQNWEYTVAMDGGETERVASSEYHNPGEDISIKKNYWGVWEK